uniref:hypothetical protein n=1 Tax=Marinobacterium profundum TaxID=1714300 RepID=UPI000831CF6C|nr:hypothetical protein [Marinobacterium profundum]
MNDKEPEVRGSKLKSLFLDKKKQLENAFHFLAHHKAEQAERFEEIAHLTQRLKEEEDKRQQGTRQIEALQQKLERSERAQKESDLALQELRGEVVNLQRLQRELEIGLETRTEELVVLTRLLEAQRSVSATSASIVDGKRESWARGLAGFTTGNKTERQQLKLIAKSGLFDADWYLAQHPDIAAERAFAKEPVRHYLKFGGFEGRNPGPDFDSAFYLRLYPDVRESGMNPLVHYLKFGKDEGRETVFD